MAQTNLHMGVRSKDELLLWIIKCVAIIAAINSVPPPVEDAGGNRVLWKHGDDNYKPWFSSSRNLGSHHQIRVHRNVMEWSEIIWFSEAMPKFSFISWLAVRNRLSRADRTRAPHILCISYSYTLWTDLVGCFLPRPSPDWNITMNTLLSPRRNKVDSYMLRLAFQRSIYSL
ncbi:hypothetical protein IGI04_023366 [Brassica rapa subsp. trilocularis]|uniref:Reverse transcriptase zinc-binding domain-containing protein n=1 Tax=Brassica rapa subsp. trilocularis TaxID=1813537 RepID=A0ABQ7M5T7_BRACM|nr:hypothetical protein IGI04_023366 [Brassica rapa subsp. trilocularis]